jgi:hypothetical protein
MLSRFTNCYNYRALLTINNYIIPTHFKRTNLDQSAPFKKKRTKQIFDSAAVGGAYWLICEYAD